MNDALEGTQQAIYDALVSAGVSGGRIYDDVPESPTFPYVIIGETVADSDDATGTEGTDSTETIYVWSRQRGFKECKQIMSAIHATLHQKSLMVTGRDTAHLFWNGSLTRRDGDGISRQGVVRIRVVSSVKVV
jgi:Protein of unknown function (DUF3168)